MILGPLPTDMRYASPYAVTGAPAEALGTVRREASLAIVTFILVILGLGCSWSGEAWLERSDESGLAVTAILP